LTENRIVTAKGQTYCKICRVERARESRAANPEANREAVRKYRLAHPRQSTPEQKEQKRAYGKEYYARKVGRPVKTEPKYGPFRADPKGYHLRWLLEKRYGITLEQYDEMVALQGGRCAICNKLPKGTSHTSRRLAVDHDHATNAVRGLLCGPCNTTIGMIEDSPDLLDRMRRYLSKHAQLRLVEKT
jgi:hypothetical protein